MVRISTTILALAATAMTAAVDVRSTGGISASAPHELHARSVSGMYFVKRQAGPGNSEADKKFEQFKGTLNADQKAKGEAAAKAAEEADKSLSAEQRKALDEADRLAAQGNIAEADKKFDQFMSTLNEDQKAKGAAAAKAAEEADKSLSAEQRKALEEIDRLGAQERQRGK